MERFEPYFRDALKSPNALLTIITNYILRRKGKRLRPMLVFLSARAVGQLDETAYTAATLIELLHTATLVHDDVVDETYQRRGQFSVNAIWNSKVAVLVGDFFLSRGLQTAIDNNQFGMLKVITEAVQAMSEGELEQMAHAGKMDIDEGKYYDVIRKKTAALFASCTSAGAISAGAGPEAVQTLKDYGTFLGMAFQIRDDIFDYEGSGLLGKPSGNDIKERKLTLPIIYALDRAPADERRRMLRLIAHKYKDDATVEAATAFVNKYDGLAYARRRMEEFGQRAKESIAGLPPSEAKESLVAIVDYNSSRKR